MAVLSAVTNARFATLHGLLLGPVPPLDRARSASQNRALVTNDIRSRSRKSGGFRLRLGARMLRFGFVALCVALRLRSTSRSRPQTEALTISQFLELRDAWLNQGPIPQFFPHSRFISRSSVCPMSSFSCDLRLCRQDQRKLVCIDLARAYSAGRVAS